MIVCAGVTPGEIGCHVANPSFVLSDSHTVAELSGGTVTFALTTSAAASLSTGSSISLFRPLGLFDFAIVPSRVCIVACPNHSIFAPFDGQFHFTVSHNDIAASSSVVVTVFGLKLGCVTSGSATGVRISTSSYIVASAAVSSGAVYGRVKSVEVLIRPNQRICSTQQVVAVAPSRCHTLHCIPLQHIFVACNTNCFCKSAILFVNS